MRAKIDLLQPIATLPDFKRRSCCGAGTQSGKISVCKTLSRLGKLKAMSVSREAEAR